jgi:hypothetical protein
MRNNKMPKQINAFAVFLILLTVFAGAAHAQKTPAYKITDVVILPFDEQTGQFQSELTANSNRSFFNDIAISMLVKVEITGTKGSFEVGRKLEVTVMEGKKVKKKRFDQIGLIGDGGKYYVPIWLDGAMCDEVKISARIFVGAKPGPTVTRKVPFQCGE